jgi:hypothetical protein
MTVFAFPPKRILDDSVDDEDKIQLLIRELWAADTRIAQLEKLNATLAARIDELEREARAHEQR